MHVLGIRETGKAVGGGREGELLAKVPVSFKQLITFMNITFLSTIPPSSLWQPLNWMSLALGEWPLIAVVIPVSSRSFPWCWRYGSVKQRLNLHALRHFQPVWAGVKLWLQTTFSASRNGIHLKSALFVKLWSMIKMLEMLNLIYFFARVLHEGRTCFWDSFIRKLLLPRLQNSIQPVPKLLLRFFLVLKSHWVQRDPACHQKLLRLWHRFPWALSDSCCLWQERAPFWNYLRAHHTVCHRLKREKKGIPHMLRAEFSSKCDYLARIGSVLFQHSSFHCTIISSSADFSTVILLLVPASYLLACWLFWCWCNQYHKFWLQHYH